MRGREEWPFDEGQSGKMTSERKLGGREGAGGYSGAEQSRDQEHHAGRC